MIIFWRGVGQLIHYIASWQQWVPLRSGSAYMPWYVWRFWTYALKKCPTLCNHPIVEDLLYARPQGTLAAREALVLFENFYAAGGAVTKKILYNFLDIGRRHEGYFECPVKLQHTIEMGWKLYPQHMLAWLEELHLFSPHFIGADGCRWLMNLCIQHPCEGLSMRRLKHMLLIERSFFHHPDPSNLIAAEEWQGWSTTIDGHVLPWNDSTWQLVRQYKLYSGEDEITLQRSLFKNIYAIFTTAEQYGAAALGIHPHGCHVPTDVMAVYHRAMGMNHYDLVSDKVIAGLQLDLSPEQWVEYMDNTREHITYDLDALV